MANVMVDVVLIPNPLRCLIYEYVPSAHADILVLVTVNQKKIITEKLVMSQIYTRDTYYLCYTYKGKSK